MSTKNQKCCHVVIVYLQEQPNHKSNVNYALHVCKNNQTSTMLKLEDGLLIAGAGGSNNFQHKRDDKHTFEIESVQVYVLCLYYMHDFRDAFFFET